MKQESIQYESTLWVWLSSQDLRKWEVPAFWEAPLLTAGCNRGKILERAINP